MHDHGHAGGPLYLFVKAQDYVNSQYIKDLFQVIRYTICLATLEIRRSSELAASYIYSKYPPKENKFNFIYWEIFWTLTNRGQFSDTLISVCWICNFSFKSRDLHLKNDDRLLCLSVKSRGIV